MGMGITAAIETAATAALPAHRRCTAALLGGLVCGAFFFAMYPGRDSRGAITRDCGAGEHKSQLSIPRPSAVLLVLGRSGPVPRVQPTRKPHPARAFCQLAARFSPGLLRPVQARCFQSSGYLCRLGSLSSPGVIRVVPCTSLDACSFHVRISDRIASA